MEMLPDFRRLSLVGADFENKEIHLVKVKTIPDTPPAFKKALKSFGKLDQHRIIVSLDSRRATTVYSSVSVIRESAKDAIDDADLDNVISQAVWKFFDRQRTKAAAKMEINDFDLLLSDVRVGTIKLDGHRVINPLGFKARTVDIQLGQTFTSRAVMNELREALPIDNIHFIGEAGASWARVLQEADPKNNFVLATIFDNELSIFASDGARLSHHRSHAWGRRNLLAVLTDALAVSPAVAEKLSAITVRGEASLALLKKLEVIMLEGSEDVAGHISTALTQTGVNAAYLHAFFPLPPAFLSSSFRNKLGGTVKLAAVLEDMVSERYHFQVKYKKEAYRTNSFPVLASIIETTFLPHYAKISHMAKKRVRWLSPN